MAKALSLTPEDFKRKYTQRVGLRYSLIEKQPSKDCIFLHKNGKGQLVCKVYAERPLQCRTWPFWKENLRSRTAWRSAADACPGIDQGNWYAPADIEAIRDGDLTRWNTKMPIAQAAWRWIDSHRQEQKYLDAVSDIYDDLDQHLAAADPNCSHCGQCCHFADFGHRLYVTTLEILYLTQDNPLSGDKAPSSVQGCCPLQIGNHCSVRQFRPASCRIFFCRDLDPHFQSELTEQVLARLRRLHETFCTPYLYADLLVWFPSAESG